jgi:acyl-CoA synthetase (AMP-forming)/AMP-acid ligase II
LPLPGLVQVYALTEAAAIVTCGKPLEPRSLTSSGTCLDGYEMRIASPADDTSVPTGELGEIQVKSPYLMREYFNMPEETATAFSKDGWLKTGDIGVIDEESYLQVSGGRLKEMIIRGGENIYPLEIERVLAIHPAVSCCAVFGLADQRLGEIVVAAVKLAGQVSKAELTAHCAERIAWFKVPVRYFSVSEMPMTPSGKIKKPVLADWANKEMLEELL